MNQLALAGVLAFAIISGYYLTLPDPNMEEWPPKRFETSDVAASEPSLGLNEERVAETVAEVEAASARLKQQIERWREN